MACYSLLSGLHLCPFRARMQTLCLVGTDGAGREGWAPTHICTAVLTATKSGQGPWEESPSWPQLPVPQLFHSQSVTLSGAFRQPQIRQ